MSFAMGASSAGAFSPLASLQQLLQPDKSGKSRASAGSDPLADLMKALTGGDESSGEPASTTATATASASSATSRPAFGPGMMAALLSAQSEQSGENPTDKLFAKLDADRDGKISKSEFMSAADKAGADSSVANAVFDKIDSDGDSDGSISQSELAKADRGPRRPRVADANLTNAGLIEQLTKLQSQLVSAAATTALAVV